jgi:hypothetical protein
MFRLFSDLFLSSPLHRQRQIVMRRQTVTISPSNFMREKPPNRSLKQFFISVNTPKGMPLLHIPKAKYSLATYLQRHKPLLSHIGDSTPRRCLLYDALALLALVLRSYVNRRSSLKH